MKLTIVDRAQRYRDFGYASGFKERHPIEQWSRMSRYACSRYDSLRGYRRIVFSMPVDRYIPLLPRWANR